MEYQINPSDPAAMTIHLDLGTSINQSTASVAIAPSEVEITKSGKYANSRRVTTTVMVAAFHCADGDMFEIVQHEERPLDFTPQISRL